MIEVRTLDCGYIVISKDGFNSIMTKVCDNYAEECITKICNNGYIFEGLRFNAYGEIEDLYFRKEQ